MVHELRIYTAHQDKMGGLLARFRDHTMGLFEKHGITNVAYWLNTVGGRSDELWYIVSFESMAQRDEAWASFRTDPDWKKVREESEADGPLVHHIENRMISPTSFSPMQ